MIIDIEEVQLEIISDPLPSPPDIRLPICQSHIQQRWLHSVGINQNIIATYKLYIFSFIASECVDEGRVNVVKFF